MLKNFSELLKKGMFTIITVLIVLACFYYYFNFYQPQKQKEIYSEKFRVLTRLSENFNRQLTALEGFSFANDTIYKSFDDTVINTITEFTDTAWKKLSDSLDNLIAEQNANSKAITYQAKEISYTDQQDVFDSLLHKADLGSYIDLGELAEKYEGIKKGEDLQKIVCAFYNYGETIEEDKLIVVSIIWTNDKFYTNLLRNDFNYYAIEQNGKFILNTAERVGFNQEIIKAATTDSGGNRISASDEDIEPLKNSFRNGNTAPAFAGVCMVNLAGEEFKLFTYSSETEGGLSTSYYGLISNTEIIKNRNALPDTWVLGMLSFIILFILILPFIKLVLLNKQERFSSTDLMATQIASMLIVAIITCLFIYFNQYKHYYKTRVQSQMHYLQKSVATEFENDVTTAINLLVAANDSIEQTENKNKDIRLIAAIEKNDTSTLSKKIIYHSELVNSLFFLDKKGKQKFAWGTVARDFLQGDYSKRNYFINIKENKTNYIHRTEGCENKYFFIQPVISWTTGEFRTVISTSSNDSLYNDSLPRCKERNNQFSVSCISTNVLNTSQEIIPEGYGYAIINSNGDILYCSDKFRRLNENLFESVTDSQQFRSAVYSKTTEWFTTSFHGSEYDFTIQPMNNLPYSIVAWHQLNYDMLLMDQTMIYAISMLCIIVTVIALLLAIIYFTKKRDGRMMEQRLDIGWLWPQNHKKEFYLKIIYYNIFSVFISTLIYIVLKSTNVASENFTLFMLVLCSQAIIFSGIFTFWQSEKSAINKHLLGHKISYGAMGVIGLAICFGIAGSFAPGILFMLVQTGIQAALMFYINKLEKKELPGLPESKARFISAFVFMSWLIISCVFPSVIFTKYGYDQEMRKQLKNNQLAIAEKFTQYIRTETNATVNTEAIKTAAVKAGRFLLKDTIQFSGYRQFNGDTLRSDVFYRYIMNRVDLVENKITNHQRFMDCNESTDGNNETRHWNAHNDALHLVYNTKLATAECDTASGFIPYNNKNCCYFAFGVVSPFDPLSPFEYDGGGKFYFVFISLLIAFCFFILVKYIINKYFHVSLNRTLFDKEAIKQLLNSTENTRHIFITGLPGSGKYKVVRQSFATPDDTIVNINFFKIPDAVPDSTVIDDAYIKTLYGIKATDVLTGKVAVVRHFEYNFRNTFITSVKLNTIEWLLNQNIRIIMVSDIQPVTILQSYADNEVYTDKAELNQIKEDIDRWSKLLGYFYNIYYKEENSVEYELTDEEKEGMTPEQISEENIRLNLLLDELRPECEFGSFLPQLGTQLAADKNLRENWDRAEVVNRVFQQAKLYYHNIWSTLTTEEQHLIYDLAQDGILNTKNIHLIRILYEKGIFIADSNRERIMLFNRSFKYFIINEVKKEDALMLEKKSAEHGRWVNYKTPIVVIIISLIVFVVSTQQESFNSILTYVSMFLTGIAFFQRLFLAFDFKGGKPV